LHRLSRTRFQEAWYLNESRSEDVEEFIQEREPVDISDLTVVEMRCLLARAAGKAISLTIPN